MAPNVRTFNTSRGPGRAELLPNGFVRVDSSNDQPRLWERDQEHYRELHLRSGYPMQVEGRPSIFLAELRAVGELLGCCDRWHH